MAASGVLLLAPVVFSLITGVASASAAQPHHLIVTLTPPGPYVIGQTVTVTVPANPILRPGRSLTIEECSARVSGRVHWELCDPHTVQSLPFIAGSDGSATYAAYPLVSLPDATLGESSRHRPTCGLTHPCTLRISGAPGGPGHWVWSNSFMVSGNPGTGTPEAPSVLALPVVAGLTFLGWILVRRRKAHATTG